MSRVTHTITHVQRTKKSKNFGKCVVIRWAGVRIRLDLPRTPNERHSFIVCVNLCAHFLHVQKCERFFACECRRQKNIRPRLGANVLGTSVLEYRFCSTRRHSVLVLLKSTCTRTCTQVLLKTKVLTLTRAHSIIARRRIMIKKVKTNVIT